MQKHLWFDNHSSKSQALAVKVCLQDGKDAAQQLETNFKFLLKWDMQAGEVSASSITMIKPHCYLFLPSLELTGSIILQ